MISLNKRNIAILLLSLVLFALLPFHFTWNETALYYMDFDCEPTSAVLFWIFYISVLATALAAVFNRYDITRLTSLISTVFIVILLFQTTNTVNHGKLSVIDAVSIAAQNAYAYIALTVVIFILSIKVNTVKK